MQNVITCGEIFVSAYLCTGAVVVPVKDGGRGCRRCSIRLVLSWHYATVACSVVVGRVDPSIHYKADVHRNCAMQVTHHSRCIDPGYQRVVPDEASVVIGKVGGG